MLTVYIFSGILGLVFTMVYRRMPHKNRLKLIRKLSNDRIMSELKKLMPSGDAVSELIRFFDRRLTLFALSVTLGSVLVIASEIKTIESNELLEGNMIKRNSYLGGKKDVKLKVHRAEDENREEVDIVVSDKGYTHDELIQMASEADEIIAGSMPADNPSADEIISDLSFVTSIPGYPFKISWRTEDPLLIGRDGRINRDRFEKLKEKTDIYEGVETGIHYELTYEDFVHGTDLAVRVFPENMNNEMTLSQYVKELAHENDISERKEDYLKLPDEVDGQPLIYEEIKDKKSIILLILTLMTALGLYLREGEELKKKVKEREKELINDYPQMVNKFLLFYSAGLTTRGIVSKLCREYRISLDKGGKKRYLYEEMLICEGHMNEGMGEITAYEGFAAGCGVHKYRHFISLVTQAIGKGRSDLLIQLEREASDAFQDRKNRARELGEEAGTKLLFPMIMMLFTVLIIVMVPAFISFRF